MAALNPHKPSFLIVGVAKAGTTNVYEILRQHPEIYLPKKETFFFNNRNLLSLGKGEPNNPYEDLISDEKTYLSVFEDCPDAAISGEVATGYLYDYQNSIPKIKATLGDPKIVVILRNPVTRCYSSYMHFVKNAMETLSFEQALEIGEERMELGYTFMWHHKNLSLYASAVEAYMKQFSQVKVLFFEQLVSSKDAFFNELHDFLEVSKTDTVASRTNTSGKPKSHLMQGLITKPNPIKHAIRPLFRAIVPLEKRKGVREWLKNKNLRTAEKMLPETKEKLTAFFADDIAKLEQLLGKEINYWKG